MESDGRSGEPDWHRTGEVTGGGRGRCPRRGARGANDDDGGVWPRAEAQSIRSFWMIEQGAGPHKGGVAARGAGGGPGMHTTQNGPSAREGQRGRSDDVNTAEAEGLEPPKACARRISSAVPYQLDYASNKNRLVSRDGRI